MEDQIAYHLVTNNRMNIGQKIVFNSETKNNVFNFFFGKEFFNSKGEEYFQILKNNTSPEGIILKKEDADTILKYSDITIRGIRELITEIVRTNEFATKPSRLSCLYAARTFEEVLEWKNVFDSYNRKTLQIVKLKYDGNSFLGDGEKLPKNNAGSFINKMKEAREYWSSISKNNLPEMLIDGEITVIEILKEYE